MKFPILLILIVAKVEIEGVLVIQDEQLKTTALFQWKHDSDSEMQDSPATKLEKPVTFTDEDVIVGYHGKYRCLLIPYETFVSKRATPKLISRDWVVQMHSCKWNGEEIKDRLLTNYNLFHFNVNEQIPKWWYEFAYTWQQGLPWFKVCERDNKNVDSENRDRYVGIVIVDPSDADSQAKLQLNYKVLSHISANEIVSESRTANLNEMDYCLTAGNTPTPLILYQLLMAKMFPKGTEKGQKLVLLSLEFNGKVHTGDLKLCTKFFRVYDGEQGNGLKEFELVSENLGYVASHTFMMYEAKDMKNLNALASQHQMYVGFENSGSLIR